MIAHTDSAEFPGGEELTAQLSRQLDLTVDALRRLTPARLSHVDETGTSLGERTYAVACEISGLADRLMRPASPALSPSDPPRLAVSGSAAQLAVLGGELLEALDRTPTAPPLPTTAVAELTARLVALRQSIDATHLSQ